MYSFDPHTWVLNSACKYESRCVELGGQVEPWLLLTLATLLAGQGPGGKRSWPWPRSWNQEEVGAFCDGIGAPQAVYQNKCAAQRGIDPSGFRPWWIVLPVCNGFATQHLLSPRMNQISKPKFVRSQLSVPSTTGRRLSWTWWLPVVLLAVFLFLINCVYIISWSDMVSLNLFWIWMISART